MKHLKGSRTAENLLKAFAGESQARMRYTFYAKTAGKEGYKQIEELAGGGRRLDARPVSRATQSVDFNRNTASVTATEVWNLRVVAVGSEAVLSESPAQENQILYSLTRDGGRWWILSRILARSSED